MPVCRGRNPYMNTRIPASPTPTPDPDLKGWGWGRRGGVARPRGGHPPRRPPVGKRATKDLPDTPDPVAHPHATPALRSRSTLVYARGYSLRFWRFSLSRLRPNTGGVAWVCRSTLPVYGGGGALRFSAVPLRAPSPCLTWETPYPSVLAEGGASMVARAYDTVQRVPSNVSRSRRGRDVPGRAHLAHERRLGVGGGTVYGRSSSDSGSPRQASW